MKCTVQQGCAYRALIEVPFFKRAFASPEVIAARLTEAGFVNVQVQSAGGGKYWAWGTWGGDDACEEVDYVTRLDKA